jgi:hypothetical protein
MRHIVSFKEFLKESADEMYDDEIFGAETDSEPFSKYNSGSSSEYEKINSKYFDEGPDTPYDSEYDSNSYLQDDEIRKEAEAAEQSRRDQETHEYATLFATLQQLASNYLKGSEEAQFQKTLQKLEQFAKRMGQ